MADFPSVLFDLSNQSAFGTLESSELTPVLQVDFVNGLNTQILKTAVVSGTGATVDTNAARLRLQSGTNAAGYAYIESRQTIRYRAGQGTMIRFTPIFAAGTANNTQLQGVGAIAAAVPYDGYFFGYNGTSFGVAHYVRGVAAWSTQTADWNGDKCDGSAGSSFTLNTAFGNVYQIKYPYLGYGDIRFFIQNPTTGRMVLCHTIRYANTVATTQLSNPALFFLSYILNSGNTSNLIMYAGSFGVFVSGPRLFVSTPKWAMDASEATVTTENVILSLRNATTYNTVTNRGMIRLNNFSYASSAATGTSVFRFKLGATIGGTPAFTTINGTTADNGVTITSGNSITSFDVAGTTVASGTYIFSTSVDNPNSGDIDLLGYNIFIPPGETLTISGSSSVSSTMGCSINWTEDI